MAGDWLDTYSLQRGSFQQARFFVWYVYFLVVLNLTWLDIYKEVRCPIWNPSPQEFYLGIGLGSGLDLAHLDLQACLYSLHRKFQNLISTKSCWSHRASPNTVSESATCEPACWEVWIFEKSSWILGYMISFIFSLCITLPNRYWCDVTINRAVKRSHCGIAYIVGPMSCRNMVDSFGGSQKANVVPTYSQIVMRRKLFLVDREENLQLMRASNVKLGSLCFRERVSLQRRGFPGFFCRSGSESQQRWLMEKLASFWA